MWSVKIWFLLSFYGRREALERGCGLLEDVSTQLQIVKIAELARRRGRGEVGEKDNE